MKKRIDIGMPYADLADKMHISRQRVWYWFQPGNKVPAEKVLTVERLTGVSRHALRPDIYPVSESKRAL